MNNRILVTYASKYGATAEIAERIGTVLRLAGIPTDVLPVVSVNNVTQYQAVILGSAVYAGQWRKEAVLFLEQNEKAFSEVPVWIFSSGPTGKGEPVELLKGWRVPDALLPIVDRIRPRDTAVFHGDLDMAKLNLGEKIIIKGVKATVGDFRDWDAIKRWAEEIGKALTREAAESYPAPKLL